MLNRRRSTLTWALLLACLLGPATPHAPADHTAPAHGSPAPDGATTAADALPTLYQRARAAGVEVLTDGHLAGSGWFASADGLAVTAAHVIARPGRRLELLSAVAGRVEAKVIAVDLGHDLALLQAPPRDGGYPALPFADAAPFAQKTPDVGQSVYLFGAPLYRHHVLLRGMAARPEPGFEWLGDQGHYIRTLYLSGHAPQGTSGGPWLNARGHVIGMQSGLMSLKNAPLGVAFCVPMEPVKRLVQTRTSAATPTMGAPFEELWEHGQPFLDRLPEGTRGLVVRKPREAGPAAQAGLKEFDIVTAVDGRPVQYRDDLITAVRNRKPGDEVELSIITAEDHKPAKVKVKLGLLEAKWAEAIPGKPAQE